MGNTHLFLTLFFVALYRPSASNLPNLFQALDSSSLPENLKIHLNSDQIEKNDPDFRKGVSLSFNLVDAAMTEHPQQLFSLYGNSITLHRTEREVADKDDICYNVTVVTPYSTNITYMLKGCHSRYLYLDLYNMEDDKLSFLYDDLVPAQSDAMEEWSKYEDLELDGDEILLLNYSSDTLVMAKEFCSYMKPTPENPSQQQCCGVTELSDGSFSLRSGRNLVESSESGNVSTSGVISWKHRQCNEYSHEQFNITRDIVIFATEESVKLSHINIDPLVSIDDKKEASRRFRRFELGNLVVGKYLGFDKVPYNAKERSSTDRLLRLIGTKSVSRVRFLTVGEGMLLENRRVGGMNLIANGVVFQASFFWVAGGVFHYCLEGTEIGSIDLDDRAESVEVETTDASNMFLSLKLFYTLRPTSNNRHYSKECTLEIPDTVSPESELLIQFKTSENGYRVKLGDEFNQFVAVNKSSEQSILHRMTLQGNVGGELSVTGKDCRFWTYTTGICNATYSSDEGGHYLLGSSSLGENVTVPCSAERNLSSSWTCDQSSGEYSRPDNESCPFYQCDSQHKKIYVIGEPNIRLLAGRDESGECCGGRWGFSCVKNESERFNYTSCRKLRSCFNNDTIEFGITHPGDNRVVNMSVVVDVNLAAGHEHRVQCPDDSGTVRVKCDGCSQTKVFVSHTCEPKYCLLSGEIKTFNFTWNNSTKYGNGSDFNYTLSGPFSSDNETQTVPCPYNGTISISCRDTKFNLDWSSCSPAPKCPATTEEPHPLKGKFEFESTFAAEMAYSICPANLASRVSRFCSAEGKWEDFDHVTCELLPCESERFERDGVVFDTGVTEPNTTSHTTCDRGVMCESGKCGTRVCLPDSGRYSAPDFTWCQFNCTHDNSTVIHGSNSPFSCPRQGGEEGVRYVECENNVTTSGQCVLTTCPYGGGAGCVETNPEKLESLAAEELIEDFNTYLDDIDLSSDQAKADTENVVNAVMTKSLGDTETVGQEQKEKVTQLVDKVSIRLAKSGGKIITERVAMYGIPAPSQNEDEGGGRKRRDDVPEDYLGSNGISGRGFNGSIGLAIYSDTSLFSPKNTSEELLVSEEIKSVTTEFESRDISVNISFRMTGRYNRSALKCVFYNTSTGDWLTEGCFPFFDDSNFICQCTHLTSFAVLVSMDDIQSESQSLLTKITLYTSCTALIMTICCILPYRKLRNRDIIKIHLLLVTSMLVGDIAFLSLDVAASSETACLLATAITHFAWLSVFGWMVAEGFTMYNQTVLALKSYGKRANNYTCLLATFVHGGALILPTLCLILHFTWADFSYIRPLEPGGVCFINIPWVILVTFLVPLYVVLVCSVFIFVRVSMVVIRSKSQGKRKKNTNYWKKQLRAVISIATVTGISWVIAPFVILGHGRPGSGYSVTMQWIFSVLMGLQGVVIFVVLVILSEDVCNTWVDMLKSSSFAKLGYALASDKDKSRFDEGNSKVASYGDERSATKSSLLGSMRGSNTESQRQAPHGTKTIRSLYETKESELIVIGKTGSQNSLDRNFEEKPKAEKDSWVKFVESTTQAAAVGPLLACNGTKF